MRIDYSLYLVMDDSVVPTHNMINVLSTLVTAGITCVQLRMKKATPSEIKHIASQMLQLLKPHHIPLIINDHVDIAVAIDADGVHIGQQDISPFEARKQLGDNKIIGLSIENLQQAKSSHDFPVDYFGIGPIFPTDTKSNATTSIGIDGLLQIKKILSKPIVAIGGINTGNLVPVLETGIDGIAIISAILAQSQPDLAAKEIAKMISANEYPCVLTIAGSDSSGGAGIQADIKAISATGSYAASVITALTAQNTLGVQGVQAIPPAFVAQQIESVLDDLRIRAVKIGMLFDANIIKIVAEKLEKFQIKNAVLDPVMIAKSGDALLKSEAISALKSELISKCYLITPNLDEAEKLLETRIRNREEMAAAATALGQQYQTNVLVKGGHLSVDDAADVLFLQQHQSLHWFQSTRIDTKNTHGTGCTYSAAIASFLAQKYDLYDAVSAAKKYVDEAIIAAQHCKIGHGFGPLHHFYFLK